jgi:uncharacterized protein YndB with AHSA1/START domain
MITETRSIVVDYDLPHPPEKVWRALTDAAVLGSWLMPIDFRSVVGHRFTFRAQPMPGWDGIVHCEVRQVDAPRRLVYSWRGGSGADTLDSVVTWTLERTADGTRLTLEHAGFGPHNEMAFEAMSGGWRGHVGDALRETLAREG